MIWVAFVAGLILGAPLGLFWTAMVIAGKQADERHDSFGAGYAQGYRVGRFEATAKAERDDTGSAPWTIS